MQIGGIQKTSFIDYPGKIAAVIFTNGCNFSCGYCHNGDLAQGFSKKSLEEHEILKYLKSRINKLDAVVISGGEPTLQKDLAHFIKEIKAMSFPVKLDSNGTNPEIIKKLVSEKLVDYIAMDVKAPLETYELITSRKIDVNKIKDSIDFIKNCGIDYEFRTTVVKSQLSFDDFEKIGRLLSGSRLYFLQKFKNNSTLNLDFSKEETYSDEEFLKIKSMLEKYIKNVGIR